MSTNFLLRPDLSDCRGRGNFRLQGKTTMGKAGLVLLFAPSCCSPTSENKPDVFLQFPRPHSVQQWPLLKAKHICPVSTCLNNFSIFIIILSFLEPWAFRCGIASAVAPGKVKVYRSAQIAILSASSLFTFVPMFWLSTKQSNERAGFSCAAIELSIDAMIISGGEVGRGSSRM